MKLELKVPREPVFVVSGRAALLNLAVSDDPDTNPAPVIVTEDPAEPLAGLMIIFGVIVNVNVAVFVPSVAVTV